MKKIFSFSRKRTFPASVPPRRDSGVQESDSNSGYLIRAKDLEKIHKAASTGDVAKVQHQLLLRKSGVNDRDKMNRTPLHLACANGYPDVVTLLVERNCDLNLLDNDSLTPLIKAVQGQHEECATILLQRGADLNVVDTINNTALHYAAFGQNTAIAAKLLKHNMDIEAKNMEGFTPLVVAITESNLDMVDFFLKNGANVNASDNSERTALMHAARGKSISIVNLLLQYDVDISCRDKFLWTACHHAKATCHPIHHQLIIHYGKQKALNQPLSSEISSSEGASDPEFTLGAPAMEQTDAFDSESPSTSGKSQTHRSVKEMQFHGNSPCQSLPLRNHQAGSSNLEKTPSKIDETAGPGSGPKTRFRAVIEGEKQNIQKQCAAQLPLTGEQDLIQELEFKGSSEESQESLDKSDPEQNKITSETVNIPEQTAPGKQVKPFPFPVSYLERKSQGLEPNKESNSDNVHLDVESNWEGRYGKVCVAEEKMEVKKNFKIVAIELKQIFGQIYEKDNIADQPTEKLQDEVSVDGFEEETEKLQEASLNLTNNSSDTEEKEKYRGSLNVGVQTFPERREYSLEDAVLKNLKLTFQENVLQSSSNLCSESSTLYQKKGNKSEIECTCNLNEEHVAYDAENIKIANSEIAINEMKEDGAFSMQLAGNLKRNTKNLKPDSGCLLQSSSLASHFDVWHTHADDMKSIIQEKKPKLTTETKFNEKIKLKENLFQKSDHNANNSANKLRLWKHLLPCSNKTSPMNLDKELNQDMRRFKNELRMVEVDNPAFEGKKRQLQKKIEEEKKEHQCNQIETLEEKDRDNVIENRTVGRVNEMFPMENNQHGKDREHEIPGEEISIMGISSSTESSAPVHHFLKGMLLCCGIVTSIEEGNDSVIHMEEVEKPQNDKWISEDLGINSSCEKVNFLSDVILHVPEDGPLSEADDDKERPSEKTLNEKYKDKVQMDAGDAVDLTKSSDTATEDYDLPPFNCKNVLLVIDQHRVNCKDSLSLLKIQDAVLRFERSIKRKKGYCTLLARKVKSLENKITRLQEELSETREMKSQLEHQKAEQDRELCSLRFTLKQDEEKRVTPEMLFEKIREQLRRIQEQHSKEVELKQQLEFTLRTLDCELRTIRNNLRQVSDSNEKEKYLLHKNQTLQDEVAKFKLELDTVKIKHQEKENQYTRENEVLKEKNDELQKELKLNEEALTKTISQYSEQVNVLTTENEILSSKFKNEKQNRDKTETEIESYRSRLSSAICDHEQSQISKLGLEHSFQQERNKWFCLQDKLSHDLSSLRERNDVLSQELSKAESKANSLENELHHVRDSLKEKTLILESTQRELNQAQYKAKELEEANQMKMKELNTYVIKQESIQERLAQIQSENMLLQQQLEDAQNKGILKENVLNDGQVPFIDLFNKLHADMEKQVLMVEGRNKELISECNHLRERICKYENEKAKREPNTERETIKKLIEVKQSLENRLQQEMKRNDELQELSGFKKPLKTTKKLREYENGDVHEREHKQTHSEMDRQMNRLKNKIEDLTQQLEAESSKCKLLESINQRFRGELFSTKILQKKCDKLEENKRQLEEEVVNLKLHLEITKLERSQVEQYKREIEERVRQEIIEKLKEVNLFLQIQAASQENLERLREDSNASLRNQMEQQIRHLESELSKTKKSHQESVEAERERYRKLYSEEFKIRESFSDKLNSPVLEPPHLGNVNTHMFLRRSRIPRRNSAFSTQNIMSSESRVGGYLAKMRQELQENITRELRDAGFTDQYSSTSNLN